MTFAKQFRAWTQKVKSRADYAFQDICGQVSMSIAEKSPTSTGQFLGQWSPSKNTETRHTYQGGESAWKKTPAGWIKDPAIARQNREAAMANLEPRIQGTIKTLEMGDTYYFTNHTEYSLVIEYEGWVPHGGKRAPYRMVGRTFAEIQKIVQLAINEAKAAR